MSILKSSGASGFTYYPILKRVQNQYTGCPPESLGELETTEKDVAVEGS